jgi:hypothetical protein
MDTNTQGMIFDSAPVTKPTPAGASTNAPASANDGGMTFDTAPVKTALTVPPTGGPMPTQSSAAPPSTGATTPTTMATMSAPTAPTGPLDHIQQWANNVADDLRYGTNRTGIGSLLKHIGAQPLESGTSSGVADFMGSIPLGALKMIKGASEYLNPTANPLKGVKDVTGGALQASTIPGGFVAPESGEAIENAAGAVGDVAKSAASAVKSAPAKAANAVKGKLSLKAVQEALQNSTDSIQQALQSNLQGIQDAWHGSVRDLFDQVAKEAGVQPKPAESLRDVAANTAAAVKAKASGLYKQLDTAIGGTRFQTYDEQLSNVRRALKNSAGIDPDADGRLVERINDLEDAKAAALEQAKTAGVDPNLIDQANSAWRQASALEDLSKHIQASTSGLRGDLAPGLRAAPESLSPAKLATRANRMYNTGRLQQAVGEDHADDLLRKIETTKQQAQDAAENAAKQTESATAKAVQRTAAVRRNQTIATTAAGGIGAGTAWAWLKHLLGE